MVPAMKYTPRADSSHTRCRSGSVVISVSASARPSLPLLGPPPRAPRPPTVGQLLAQCAPGLDEQRSLDGLVRHAHGRVTRIVKHTSRAAICCGDQCSPSRRSTSRHNRPFSASFAGLGRRGGDSIRDESLSSVASRLRQVPARTPRAPRQIDAEVTGLARAPSARPSATLAAGPTSSNNNCSAAPPAFYPAPSPTRLFRIAKLPR